MNTDEHTLRTQAAQDGVTHFVTGVAIFRDGKLLVVRRAVDDFLGGLYEIPGGGVDEGETFEVAAAREALEETGLVVTRVVAEFEGFDYETDSKPKVRQYNYAVEVAPGEVTLEPTEHDDYQWITKTDIDTLQTSPEMKTCLRAAFSVDL
jgi:8-oxo-dGTP diphosphatase